VPRQPTSKFGYVLRGCEYDCWQGYQLLSMIPSFIIGDAVGKAKGS